MDAASPPAASVRIAGHFGELLQGRLGPRGPVVLVTLPCPAVGLSACLVRGAGVAPDIAALLCRLGMPAPDGFAMHPTVEAGLGTGVSTARLVAAAALAGWSGPPETLARACLAVEGATDPLMFPRPGTLLWASREARIVRELPSLPVFEIVGGFFGPPIYTDPADDLYPDIADLAESWAPADVPALAAESANRTLALRGPADDPTPALARELGALGWQMSHSGAARGLIFAPGTTPPDAEARMAARGLRGILRFRTDGRP
jgi:uncharacterized protein involved in propanediol utilization